MMSDFAPEVAKYPKSNPKPKNSPKWDLTILGVRAYCLAPVAMQLSVMCTMCNTVEQFLICENQVYF